MGRKPKSKENEYRLKTEEKKELLRLYDFWKGLYVQRNLHKQEPDLVSAGTKALTVLHPHIQWPRDIDFDYVRESYNGVLLAWALRKLGLVAFITQPAIITAEVRDSLNVLLKISAAYGYFAYDLLFLTEINPLLEAIERLNKERNGEIPIQEIGTPLSIFITPSQALQKNIDLHINTKDFNYEKAMQEIRDTLFEHRLLANLEEKIEMSALEEYDFVNSLASKRPLQLQKNHYARAIGLWLWDYCQEYPSKTPSDAIRAYQDKNFTFALAASEDRVYRNRYSITKLCIEKREVLPLK